MAGVTVIAIGVVFVLLIGEIDLSIGYVSGIAGVSVAYFQQAGTGHQYPGLVALALAIATGLGAWRWQLEGARLKGNLQLHLICALTTGAIIFLLCWRRSRLRAKGDSPRAGYFAVMALGLMMITLTGHIGGILSGVETP